MAAMAQVLDTLAVQLASLAPSHMAALQALQAADELYDLSKTSSCTGDQECLERRLIAAADSLRSLAAAASHALSAGTAPSWIVQQVRAGCCTLAACAQVADQMNLPAASAFKIASACSLVFGPGTTLLHLLLDASESPATRQLAPLCDAQLVAAFACVFRLLHSSEQPAAAAAFASSTAKPAALLPWLLAATCTLAADEGQHDRQQAMLATLTLLLSRLLTLDCFAKHREQLAGARELQHILADVLLARCLPSAAPVVHAQLFSRHAFGSISNGLLQSLSVVLAHPCLRPALQQRLLAGGSVAALRAVAEVVQMVPLPGGTGGDRALIRKLHFSGVQLLAATADVLVGALGEKLGSRGSTACAAAEGGGSSTAVVSADEAGTSITIAAATAAALGSCSDDGCVTAARQVVALVPRLAAVIQGLADHAAAGDGSDPWQWPDLGAMCGNVAAALELTRCLPNQPGTWVQLARWADAGTAGIRLQPTLLRLDARLRQPGQPAAPWRAASDGAVRLALHLSQQLWCAMPALDIDGLVAELGLASAAEQRHLATALWQLHSTHARLCHQAVSSDGPVLLGTAATRARLLTVLTHRLAVLFDAAYIAAAAAWPPGQSPQWAEPFGSTGRTGGPELRALCSTHAEALALLVTADAVPTAADPDGRIALPVRSTALLHALLYIPDCVGAPGTLSLGRAVDAAVAQLLQDSPERRKLVGQLSTLAKAASDCSCLAHAVSSSCLLSLLLQAACDLAGTADNDQAGQQADQLMHNWADIIACLASLASSTAEDAASVGAPDSLAAQLKQGAHSLRQQRRQVLAGLQPDASLAERAAQLQQLVQPAKQLAGLIHQWLQLREPSRQLLLDQGRAAAARSCAYLRCANVAGQGGPAAGQGVGSARCSACRAVWYCGTACSHADWRAGHKRVCKLMAAERQAAKAARTAAEGQ